MAGKKAKSPAKPASKAGAPAAKTAGAKKAQPGPISSLKKMLGMGAKQEKQATSKKGAAPSAAAKGRKGAAPAPVAKKGAPVKGAAGKAAAPAKALAPVKGTVAGKAQAPAKGAAGKGAAPAPTAPVKGAKGAKGGKGASKALTSLSLKGEKATHDANGAAVCREVACELMATTAHYCRMHYIKNWKKIKRKEMILKEKKLNHYIEELISKYPDKYIEAIRQDLASEKDFAKVIADLEIDEGTDDFESVDTESAEGIIDTIKRDFEDEGDVF